jgi:hypothetical protein
VREKEWGTCWIVILAKSSRRSGGLVSRKKEWGTSGLRKGVLSNPSRRSGGLVSCKKEWGPCEGEILAKCSKRSGGLARFSESTMYVKRSGGLVDR